MKDKIVLALAGNPNVGKTTFINAIAGTRLRVGNWPGVTVEKKEAELEFNGRKICLVDLPGIYSLSPISIEEIIARDFLLNGKPDVVLNIVDATNLERNLYLTLQLLETGVPIVLVLNMYDEALKKGWKIDVDKLSKLLGVPVVPTVAIKNEGVKEAIETAIKLAEEKDRLEIHKDRQIKYGEEIEKAISEVEEWLKKEYYGIEQKYPLRWLAIKVLEGDEKIMKEIGIKEIPNLPTVKHLLSVHGDLWNILAEARYGIASGIAKQCIKKEEVRYDISEKLDAIFLHRYLGFPIFFLMMWLLFKLAFDISYPFVDWFDVWINVAFANTVAWLFHKIGVPGWLESLVLDGIIAGVGTVAVFLPVIFVIMFFITFLEGTGYIARVAFLMDRPMQVMGIHGQSFLPMLVGFGCNVPSVYATRVLDSLKDRLLTSMLVPFMSCGARLPVYVVLAAALFGMKAGTVIWSIYVVGIIAAILLGRIYHKFLFKGEMSILVMELPPYRLPTLKYLLVHSWEKTKHFAIKAGTYILAMSIVVWILFNFPSGADLKDSYLGRISKTIAPLFQPLGFGSWEASASLFTGILAKEIVVVTLGQIYGLEEEEEEEIVEFPTEDWVEVLKGFPLAFVNAGQNLISAFYPTSLAPDEADPALLEKIREVFTPLTAYAFMVFVLLYVPCIVFLAIFLAEFRNFKLALIMIIACFTTAYIFAFLIYNIGRFLGLGV